MDIPSKPLLGRALALASLLSSAGCAGSAETTAPTVAPQPSQSAPARARDFRSEPDPARHMQANFWVAVELRDTLVSGELDKARSLGKWLSEQDLRGTLPPQWQPWVKDMQQSAAEVAAAPDIPTAAAAVGSLGVSCGGCHWNFGVSGPRPPDAEDQGFAPEGPEDMTTRMLRHQWAADELWFGLTIPSDAAWKDGARVLIDSPFAPPERDEQPISPELAHGIEAMRQFGTSAQHTDTMADRARLYGKLLASCADCHATGP